MDITVKLREIERIISQGKQTMFQKNMVSVDKQSCMQLLEEVQKSLPTEIQQGREIIIKKEEIIATARNNASQIEKDANKIVADAKNAAQVTAENATSQARNIVSQANNEAKELLDNARSNATQMIKDAQIKADKLVAEEDIVMRAKLEAQEIQRNTQEEVNRIYNDVYKHVDYILAELDRSISEKLIDIRNTRQKIDESIPTH